VARDKAVREAGAGNTMERENKRNGEEAGRKSEKETRGKVSVSGAPRGTEASEIKTKRKEAREEK